MAANLVSSVMQFVTRHYAPSRMPRCSSTRNCMQHCALAWFRRLVPRLPPGMACAPTLFRRDAPTPPTGRKSCLHIACFSSYCSPSRRNRIRPNSSTGCNRSSWGRSTTALAQHRAYRSSSGASVLTYRAWAQYGPPTLARTPRCGAAAGGSGSYPVSSCAEGPYT